MILKLELEKEVKKFGNGSGHIILHKSLVGKKVRVIFEEEHEI